MEATNWYFLIGIQVFLLALFIAIITYICRLVKKKYPEKSNTKTCILIWFISAIAWFIIAQIVWIVTYTQFSGG
jgi:hypothetical protein